MRNEPTPAWTLILVPPKLTSSPRRFGVKARTVRILVIVMLTIAAAPWLWTLAASQSAEWMADRLAAEQQLTLTLQDSVQSLVSASLAEQARKLPPVGMLMPVNGRVTSQFTRARLHPILQIFRAHRGVDLAAPAGTRIMAPADGQVVSVRRRVGYGLTIEISHTGGVVTRYAHCRSALVQRGDSVAKGQAIGLVGSSGLATGPHLHFEILVHGRNVDPIRFVASTRVAMTPGTIAH